jgi:asparagine synthase (glutamine-hydrolysing)
LSMAHSLEGRVPFLDRTIVEYVQCLGSRFKVRAAQRKWLHRKVCAGFLPPSILRRKKRGFAVNVVDDWFRGALDSRISDYLRDERSQMFEFLEPKQVLRLTSEHSAGAQDHHKILFSLVVLEQWLRTSIGAA